MNTEAKIENGYVLFWGGCFSNFYPCKIVHEDKEFNCSEQFFMWEKALFFNDNDTANLILKAKTPKEAKKLGRQVKGFNDAEWSKGRENAMSIAVFKKFNQNDELLNELVDKKYDGLQFVEASPYDRIWGIGYDAEHAFDVNERMWGQNLLGKIINEVREELIVNSISFDEWMEEERRKHINFK